MICKRCFRMSDDGFEYCPYCGKSFTDDTEIEVKPEKNETSGGDRLSPDEAANRPDSVPQGGYPYYGYGMPPYMAPVKHEKSPAAKFFSAIGHAALYFILFFVCQIIVTVVYMSASSANAYAAVFDNLPDDEYLSEEQYDELYRELEDALAESIESIDYNRISIISSGLTIVALIITAAIKKRPFSEHTGFYPVRTRKILLLLPLGIAVQFLVQMLINLIPWSEETIESFNLAYEYLGESTGPLAFIVEIVSVVILGPLVEELIFRGCIYTRLRRGMPTAVAVILSALAFGWAHGVTIAVFYATLLGLMLAYVYVKFGSVLAPFVLHMGFNLANYVPLMREDSSQAEIIITLVLSAVVAMACASVIILSDVSRKTNQIPEINDTNYPPIQ